MNQCETCHKRTATPPPKGWYVLVVVTDRVDASAVWCPAHQGDRYAWLEKLGVGVQGNLFSSYIQ